MLYNNQTKYFIERDLYVIRHGERSILVLDAESGREFFLPLSKIDDWWFTEDGHRRELFTEDLVEGDAITVVFPRWIAIRERLLSTSSNQSQ